MAVYSKHPASAPPSAPVREKTGHHLLRGWCIFVLFMALSGTAWINAIGEMPTAVLTIGGGVLSVGLWLAIRPPVQWRRLPWYTIAYVVWAALSIIWSQWREATALTLLLLVITTVQGLFIGSVLTWREIVRVIASALKWVMALSLVFEAWVSVVIGGPILPRFIIPAEPAADPIVYWSRDNLFDGGRLQGIMGNANLLGPVALLAIIVFAIRFASGAPRRVLLGVWIGLSAYLFYRASSATAYVAALAVVIALVAVLLMRRALRPGERTRYYVAYGVIALGGALALWVWRDPLFAALGRSSDLTGREAIWDAVLERAFQHPLIGWGYSTPWITADPAFDGWIIDHGQTVMQAHSMWIDVFFQLGLVGVFLLAMVFLAFIWRSWFFAVDRPRWDLRADRPYSPLTLLPTLVGAILLVQGFAESSPLLLWGWLFAVMLAFKIKQSPHIGEGAAELRIAIERGELTTRES